MNPIRRLAYAVACSWPRRIAFIVAVSMTTGSVCLALRTPLWLTLAAAGMLSGLAGSAMPRIREARLELAILYGRPPAEPRRRSLTWMVVALVLGAAGVSAIATLAVMW